MGEREEADQLEVEGGSDERGLVGSEREREREKQIENQTWRVPPNKNEATRNWRGGRGKLKARSPKYKQ